MKKLRSPIKYFGGKGNFCKNLLKFIPQHKIYVEVFGGGASLLFAKQPSPIEVYNDINSDLVNFFRVLRDEEKFEKFYKKVYLTPFSREERSFCYKTYKTCDDEIERAYRFFIVSRQSFGGCLDKTSWGFTINTSNNNMAQACSGWLSIIEMLPEIHQRIMRVEIEHNHFRNIFKTYDTENTFFYCDPPYVYFTRKDGKYEFEMTDKDHKELIDILISLKGKVILSGYNNDIYKKLENYGWIRKDFDVCCYTVGRTRHTGLIGDGSVKEKQKRIESIWLSPNCIDNNYII